MAGIVNKLYLAEWKAVIYSIETKNNDFKKMNYCSCFMRLFVLHWIARYRPLYLVCFVFHTEVPGEPDTLSFV